MTQRIHDRIRDILEHTPGLTQKGLADRMGLNPAAINRMLYGRRNIMAEEIPMIEDYLGVRLDLSLPPMASNIEYRQEAKDLGMRRGFSEAPAQSFSSDGTSARLMIPVYGCASMGLQKNLSLSIGAVVDWVARHPAQYGIANAFAVYISSDAMEPRYYHGELVFIHPGRPPEINRDCLVEMKNGDASVRRFLGQSDQKIRIAQFNPPQEKEISKEDIKTIYAVVGRN